MTSNARRPSPRWPTSPASSRCPPSDHGGRRNAAARRRTVHRRVTRAGNGGGGPRHRRGPDRTGGAGRDRRVDEDGTRGPIAGPGGRARPGGRGRPGGGRRGRPGRHRGGRHREGQHRGGRHRGGDRRRSHPGRKAGRRSRRHPRRPGRAQEPPAPDGSTKAGRTRWPAATPTVGGPHARTSTICAIREASPSTDRWPSPPSAGGATIEELISPYAGRRVGVPGSGGSTGTGSVTDESACAVLSYDYTVLAGTQGQQNHRKKDRMFELIERLRLPVVLFAEGGGGRPGDTDYAAITGLDTRPSPRSVVSAAWSRWSGIASGWCFAGNAALLGCCDVIIATPDASIGMGGPAMIEGGGLGHLPARGDRARSTSRSATGWSTWWPRTMPMRFVWPSSTSPTSRGSYRSWACADQRLLAPVRSRGPTAPGLRHPRPHHHPGRHRVAAGAAGRIRARHGDGLARIEGRPDRRGGQRSGSPGRGHRQRRCGQGGPVPPAVRRPRSPRPLPVRHARGSWSGRRPNRRPRSGTSAGSS